MTPESALRVSDLRLKQVAETIRRMIREGHQDGDRLGDALWSVAWARAILDDLDNEPDPWL